jgi:hypothetical protein
MSFALSASLGASQKITYEASTFSQNLFCHRSCYSDDHRTPNLVRSLCRNLADHSTVSGQAVTTEMGHSSFQLGLLSNAIAPGFARANVLDVADHQRVTNLNKALLTRRSSASRLSKSDHAVISPSTKQPRCRPIGAVHLNSSVCNPSDEGPHAG